MKFRSLIVGVFLLLTLTSCSMPTMVAHTNSLTPSSGKVVVIGRFVLSPPVLTEVEQKTHWNVIGDDRILNTVFMSTGSEDKIADSNLTGQGWQASIETQWGQPFMVELDNQTTWLNGAVMYLDALQQDRLWFPGGLYFDIPNGAKAIYIGSLHYVRNEFNTIKHIEIVNEYERTITDLNLSPKHVQVSLLQYPQKEIAPYSASVDSVFKALVLHTQAEQP